MREPTGYYWHARHGQIYPELAKLEADGYVRYRTVHQAARPDKKVYGITAKGRSAVKRWVSSPMPVQRPRDELTLRMYSLWLADPRDAIVMLDAELAKHGTLLAHYRTVHARIRASLRREPRARDDRFADLVTLERGVGYEKETIRWLRWLVGELTRRGPRDS